MPLPSDRLFDASVRAFGREVSAVGHRPARLPVCVALELHSDIERVSEWCDPEAEKNLTLADARGITHEGLRLRLAQLLVGDEHVVARKPAVAGKACDVAHVAKLVRASAALVDGMLLAHEDGHVSPDEARELRRRIALEQRHLAELDAALVEIEHVPAPISRLRRTA